MHHTAKGKIYYNDNSSINYCSYNYNNRLWCKPKFLCSEYGGDWSNGKCKGLSGEDKADYEDAVCDDPEDSAKYRKICGGLHFSIFYILDIIYLTNYNSRNYKKNSLDNMLKSIDRIENTNTYITNLDLISF